MDRSNEKPHYSSIEVELLQIMIFFNQRLVIDNFGKYGLPRWLPLGGSNQKMGSQISDSKRDKCGQSRKVLERELFSDLICEMLKIGVLLIKVKFQKV